MIPVISGKLLATLKSPSGTTTYGMELASDGLSCRDTGKIYPHVRGVPALFQPSEGDREDITSRVRSFYEENPFPNYDGVEDFGQLVKKGQSNPFTATLLDSIGYNKLILECGCGTGQLTHFLQCNNNHVLGIDMSLSSLSLAMGHKNSNQLARASFAQMNIFNLALRDQSYDVVISHAVLHHTYDAHKAFKQIARKVKLGGIIMVGLYNWYARVPTRLRSKAIGLLGPQVDYVVRNRIRDARKADIWIKDQYHNPHETWHSIDEVLGWFREEGVTYLNCSPPILGTDAENIKGLFVQTDPGNAYQRFVTQLGWLGSIAREGALFDMIGRRAADRKPEKMSKIAK
jgi:2-polyprenyl-3-methyl-5-hydroxy-6-metoxy-1,4-benzoquinol methylase